MCLGVRDCRITHRTPTQLHRIPPFPVPKVLATSTRREAHQNVPGWYRGGSGSWTGATALECSGYQSSKLWGRRTAPGAAKPGNPRHGTALHPT
eukprot:gene20750-biopygen5606